MATSNPAKRYTKTGLWQLFVTVAFPIHVWAIVLILMDLGWIAERTNFGDAIGVAAYGLSFALLESLLFFGLMVLAGFLFPKSWPEPQRISVLGTLILMPLIWAMLGQLYFLLELSAPIGLSRFLAGQAHPLWLLYGGLGLVVGPTVALAVFAALRLEKFQKGFLALVDRLGVLMGLYIFLDLVSIIIVIIRNFG